MAQEQVKIQLHKEMLMCRFPNFVMSLDGIIMLKVEL